MPAGDWSGKERRPWIGRFFCACCTGTIGLSLDEIWIDPETMQSPGNHVREQGGQHPDVPRWFQDRQKRERTDHEKQRLPVDDQAVDVPIA